MMSTDRTGTDLSSARADVFLDARLEGSEVDRSEALNVADRLWAIVNGPTAGTTAPESLALVKRLTAGIQDDPDLSVNLKLKAGEVAAHCRVLFDRASFEDSSYDDVEIVAALARNAIIKLKLVAERQLPRARAEGQIEPATEREAGAPAQERFLTRHGFKLSLGRLGGV